MVRGPDLFADHDYRPYVRLSDDAHPFHGEEALFAAVTTTHRSDAIPITDEDFTTGGLPRESYVDPWTIVSIRTGDIDGREGMLVGRTVEKVAREAASYIGVD